MRKQLLQILTLLSLTTSLVAESDSSGHVINFRNVEVKEFVRFVSRIANVNFIFDEKLLNFNVSWVSGKPTTPSNILSALSNILLEHDLIIREEQDYLLIKKITEEERRFATKKSAVNLETDSLPSVKRAVQNDATFHIYKLQYHEGSEILDAMKQFSLSSSSPGLANAINSMQWIRTSNSLLYSGDYDTLKQVTDLVKGLDKPLKQVFIEVLVIETDVRNSLDFGLQWGGSGVINNRIGFGGGQFVPTGGSDSILGAIQNKSPTAAPTGANQLPLGRGFDLSVIGDIIFHKGRSFLTLGSLVSALQSDGDTSIVLNQKIITQDNKNSKIFVGNNIPFTGSVIETVGASQQTTSNIEYRNVGVSLNIKPMLGDEDVITLDISEEISQALRMPTHATTNLANGIETTKTEMLTCAHVPNKHFLVLSGMTHTSHSNRKTGVPFLSKIPLIGAAFRRTTNEEEKRNIIIFVRPQIIDNAADHQEITTREEELCKLVCPKQDVERAINLLKPKEPLHGTDLPKLASAHTL